jgi:hypothetical protein
MQPDEPPQEPSPARSAVLESEAMLLYIFTVGALSAPELAAAAQVARVWRRVVGVDALWRAAWRLEAPSLRGQEEEEGRSFRLSLAQLRAAVTLATPRGRPWRLVDYSFLLDVSWRGAPLFAGATPATQLDEQCTYDAGTTLSFVNALGSHADAGDAPAALCAAQLQQLQTQAATADGLRARLLVRRADGALACLLDGAACTGLQTGEVGGTWAGEPERLSGQVLYASFDSARAATRGDLRVRLPAAYGVTQPTDVRLALDLTVEDHRESWYPTGTAPPGPFFCDALLLLSWFDAEQQQLEPVLDEELLDALAAGSLCWVPRSAEK